VTDYILMQLDIIYWFMQNYSFEDVLTQINNSMKVVNVCNVPKKELILIHESVTLLSVRRIASLAANSIDASDDERLLINSSSIG